MACSIVIISKTFFFNFSVQITWSWSVLYHLADCFESPWLSFESSWKKEAAKTCIQPIREVQMINDVFYPGIHHDWVYLHNCIYKYTVRMTEWKMIKVKQLLLLWPFLWVQQKSFIYTSPWMTHCVQLKQMWYLLNISV